MCIQYKYIVHLIQLKLNIFFSYVHMGYFYFSTPTKSFPYLSEMEKEKHSFCKEILFFCFLLCCCQNVHSQAFNYRTKEKYSLKARTGFCNCRTQFEKLNNKSLCKQLKGCVCFYRTREFGVGLWKIRNTTNQHFNSSL